MAVYVRVDVGEYVCVCVYISLCVLVCLWIRQKFDGKWQKFLLEVRCGERRRGKWRGEKTRGSEKRKEGMRENTEMRLRNRQNVRGRMGDVALIGKERKRG